MPKLVSATLLLRANGWKRSQVKRNRSPVGIVETRGIFHELAHRTTDEVEFRGLAGFQQSRDVLFTPVADAGLRVGSYVGDCLAVRPVRVAGEKAVRLGRAEPVSLCVTFAAVGERGNEVGAAIVRFGALRRRPEWTRSEKQQFPSLLQEAPRDGEGDVVCSVGLSHRGQ